MSLKLAIFVTMLAFANAQRSPYAGSRPGSGYKDRFVPSQTTNTVEDRFNSGGSTSTGTTQRLPIDALGDAVAFNHYNSLPIDQRPFWVVNAQHIEAHRGTPTRQPTDSTQQTQQTQQATANRFSGGDIVNRFGNGATTRLPDPNLNVISQPEVVYPSNITPEQKLQMQIAFAENHLAALREQQRQQQLQLQQQQQPQQQQQTQFPTTNGGQLTGQQANIGQRRGIF